MLMFNSPQGSPEWLAERAGVVTASRFKDARDRLKPAKGELVGRPSAKCIAYAAQVAVERIAGRALDSGFQTWQQRSGHEQEPIARAAYDIETGHVVKEVGLVTTDDRLFGYSSDGFVSTDGLLEVKTLLSADRIVQIVGNEDYSDFIDQCLGGLWITGRAWIDLAIWSPALAPIGAALHIIRIERDEDAIEKLEADLMKFAVLVDEFETKLRLKAA